MVQKAGRLADTRGRLHPRQDCALRSLRPGKVGGQQIGQPVTGILQQARVIRCSDPLPGRGEFLEIGHGF